ncbi:hypothetical protein BVX97_05870 [bacterium E08(2017)]|nr:hypothetical protein BVX97_05870 [bacterium E08(2017)]
MSVYSQIKLKRRYLALATAWILLIATATHMAYSAYGFNPTDDGFTLAYARRIIDGQVPHRDFIIIRPALSPLLHTPEIILGGQWTYWLSRFIFFLQFACISWFGTSFIRHRLNNSMTLPDQCIFAIISFTLGCHSFPVMAWHTIDGLFLCTLALHLHSVLSGRYRPLIYVLLGLAYLCKQSFIFVAPGVLLISGDWRDWRNFIASSMPGILYIGMLGLFGGVLDGWQQLFAQTGILRVGIASYLNVHVLAGVITGITASILLYRRVHDGKQQFESNCLLGGRTLIFGTLIMVTISLFFNSTTSTAFSLFGMVCGTTIYLFLRRDYRWCSVVQTGLIVALIAWSASLSLGYNTPALANGPLAVYLAGLAYEQAKKQRPHWFTRISITTMLFSIIAFHHTRMHHIYRDQPAKKLTASIGNILPGGLSISTNPNTYAFLSDLNLAIENVLARGLEYAIVPAVAGHWPKAKQKNPLPIDWAQGTELSSEALRNRVIQSILDRRDQQMIIVQKVKAPSLASGFTPIDENDTFYFIVAYIRAHLEPIVATEFFEIYR